MSIAHKNCLAANLFQFLQYEGVFIEPIFWPLIDMDDELYPKFGINWIPYYLTHLGIDERKLWKSFNINNFNDLQKLITRQPQNKLIILAPISAIKYRVDILNDAYRSTNMRHALLIHNSDKQFLEDLTIGVSGDIFSLKDLEKDQFEFPMEVFILDQIYFFHKISEAPTKNRVNTFKNKLINRKKEIISLKGDLLLSLFESNQSDLLSFSQKNSYEQALQYREIICRYQDTNKNLRQIQDAYKHNLNSIKTLFFRNQLITDHLTTKKIYKQVISFISALKKLDEKFYEIYATIQ